MAGASAVINLAGESIAGVWTSAKRRRIIESRVAAGNVLAAAIEESGASPLLVQASAIGFYGDRGGEELHEASSKGEGFLSDVAEAWETATVPVVARGIRRVVVRLGVVLGPGGFMQRVVPAFRASLGARLGSGNQWLSWVHRNDVVHAIEFLMERQDLAGVFNVVAPEPVTNGEFTHALAAHVHRPALLTLPAPLLRLGGAMPREVLLASTRASPHRLLAAGFTFDYSNIRIALAGLC